MMITNDELILYHYRDGLSAAAREAIAQALVRDPALAERSRQLALTLDGLRVTEVTAPPAMTQRLVTALRARATGQTGSAKRPSSEQNAPRAWLSVLRMPRPALVAAATVLLSVGVAFWLGRDLPDSPNIAAGSGAGPRIPTEQTARLDHSVNDYLEHVTAQLATIDALPKLQRELMLDGVLAQHRVLVIAADRAADLRTARALRAMEPVLETLGESNLSNAAGAISQLNFEMKIVQTRLLARAPALTHAAPIHASRVAL